MIRLTVASILAIGLIMYLFNTLPVQPIVKHIANGVVMTLLIIALVLGWIV